MRVFFGMILGVLLTVGVAFFHDALVTTPSSSTTGSSSSISDNRVMVNWDVVGDNLRTVKQRAREAWTTLSHKISS